MDSVGASRAREDTGWFTNHTGIHRGHGPLLQRFVLLVPFVDIINFKINPQLKRAKYVN
jgi:hypothetical protein